MRRSQCALPSATLHGDDVRQSDEPFHASIDDREMVDANGRNHPSGDLSVDRCKNDIGATILGVEADIAKRLASPSGGSCGCLLGVQGLIEPCAERTTKAFQVRMTERIHSAFPSLALLPSPSPLGANSGD